MKIVKMTRHSFSEYSKATVTPTPTTSTTSIAQRKHNKKCWRREKNIWCISTNYRARQQNDIHYTVRTCPKNRVDQKEKKCWNINHK